MKALSGILTIAALVVILSGNWVLALCLESAAGVAWNWNEEKDED